MMNNSSVLSKLKNLSEFLIMKGGKKNTSKLIKVKRPFKTKSGKVSYRDTWVLPNQVKPNEKIHNEHKLHHKLPKEHPDYKKKELHPNFVAGRDKALKERKKPKSEATPEQKKEKKGGKKKDNEPSPKDLAKQQSTMREAALRVMTLDHHADHVKHLLAYDLAPSVSIGEMKKMLKGQGLEASHKEIHDAVQYHNKNATKPHEKLGMSNMNKPLKNREIKIHPAYKDELLHKQGVRRI